MRCLSLFNQNCVFRFKLNQRSDLRVDFSPKVFIPPTHYEPQLEASFEMFTLKGCTCQVNPVLVSYLLPYRLAVPAGRHPVTDYQWCEHDTVSYIESIKETVDLVEYCPRKLVCQFTTKCVEVPEFRLVKGELWREVVALYTSLTPIVLMSNELNVSRSLKVQH